MRSCDASIGGLSAGNVSPFESSAATSFAAAPAPGHSAGASWIERLTDRLGINRRFHREHPDRIDERENVIVSPVQARLVAQGPIGEDGAILSKGGRRIALADVMGSDAAPFLGGHYLNLYLSPRDCHYWRAPCDGTFVSIRVNEGKAVLPVFTGFESFFQKADLFPRAIRANASISSVLMTKTFPIGMIAVGSLCVNAIHVLYKEGDRRRKGDLIGYFSLGSSMLLLSPRQCLRSLIGEGQKVAIGEAIAAAGRIEERQTA